MTKLEEEEQYYERFFESLNTMDEGLIQSIVDTLSGNRTVGKALINQVRIMNKSLVSSKKKYDKLKTLIRKKAPNNNLLANRIKVVDQLYGELTAKNKYGETVLEHLRKIADNVSNKENTDNSFKDVTYKDVDRKAKDAKAEANKEMGNV